jgi:hypothetical protein
VQHTALCGPRLVDCAAHARSASQCHAARGGRWSLHLLAGGAPGPTSAGNDGKRGAERSVANAADGGASVRAHGNCGEATLRMLAIAIRRKQPRRTGTSASATDSSRTLLRNVTGTC